MTHQLSLRAAILININIMLGTGIFINIAELSKRAGLLGAGSYIIMGILLLPLIWSMAHLLRIFPGGNFYTFGARAIHPFAGFISAWSYFTGKLATAILAIHVAVLLLQQLLPSLMPARPVVYDLFILSLFILLNMLHLKTGSKIQNFFLIMKAIPIIFVILSGLYLIGGTPAPSFMLNWQGVPSTLVLVLYAALGFEAACSLSNHIVDSHKNAPIALFTSYGAVIAIATLYQLLFYLSLGDVLGTLANFKQGLPLLIQRIPFASPAWHPLLTLLNLGIASSALGGSYGILFSNSWNLYTIAEHDHIFFARWFRKKNRFNIPWVCIVSEGVICLIYLLITQAQQVPLQQIAAFGCTIAYTMSVVALLFVEQTAMRVVGYLGLINCFVLLSACIYGFMLQGFSALIFFSAIVLAGMIMYFVRYSLSSVAQAKPKDLNR